MAHEDISGYSLRRGLGSGSAGTVWLLRNLATGRHAVLKRIPKAAVAAQTDFLGDLELARTIDHPHIARLLEVRESDREWLLFSQYVAAGTLTSLLERRGALSPGELVTLISPLAQALSLLHSTGLPHGQLTTNNIMFDADGRPVITDAGLRTLAPPATPESDLQALSTIAQASGSTPKTFPPSLFTTTPDHLAEQSLHQSHPLPIDLGFTKDRNPPSPPTPATPTTASTRPSPPTPPSSAAVVTPPPASRSIAPGWTTSLTSTASGGTPVVASAGSQTEPDSSGFELGASRMPGLPTLVTGGPGQPLPGAQESGRADHQRDRHQRRGRVRLPRPTHRKSAARKSGRQAARQTLRRVGRQPVTQAARQILGTKRAAYGILAACGAGALATLAIGLATLGLLGHPANGYTAAADQTPQPTPQPTPTPTTTGPQTTSQPPPGTHTSATTLPGHQATGLVPSTPPSTHATGATPSFPPSTRATGATPSIPPSAHATGAIPSPSPGAHATGRTPSSRTQSARLAESKRWLQVLQGLDAHRSRAFAQLDVGELNAVYVDGSSPWAADRALIASYRDQHLRVEGLRMKIETVTVETAAARIVVLRIVDRLVSGVAVSDTGQRTAFPTGAPTARRVTLTANGTPWRISAIGTA